jgi:hypothetical protein
VATFDAVRRLEGLAAVGFAIAYFGAIVLLNLPDQGETRQQAIDFYNSAGEKSRVLIGVYVMAAAAFCLILFVARIGPRLRVPSWIAVLTAGGAFVALYLAAAAAFVAPTLTLSLDPDGANTVDETFADFARGLSTLGDALLLICSTFAAAAFVVALAWSRVLPRWLAWSGVLVAVACLFGVAFFPLIVFAVWMLAVGIVTLAT